MDFTLRAPRTKRVVHFVVDSFLCPCDEVTPCFQDKD